MGHEARGFRPPFRAWLYTPQGSLVCKSHLGKGTLTMAPREIRKSWPFRKKNKEFFSNPLLALPQLISNPLAVAPFPSGISPILL